MTRTHRHKLFSKEQCVKGACWIVVLVVAGVFVLALGRANRTVLREYTALDKQSALNFAMVSVAKIDNTRITIPSWDYFTRGSMWSLVSAQHSLPVSFTPTLVNSPVAHAAGTSKVAKTIAVPLKSLVKAAANDGVYLMLSSAYRSAATQRDIYNSYRNLYGQSYVDSYVALPGTSEHQTGLAVDIATKTTECQNSADNCSLDAVAIRWLNENSERFGFIQRYPSGKQSITGIAGEAWHYRYVGTELAKLLTENNLTLDEFVKEVAPGYAR